VSTRADCEATAELNHTIIRAKDKWVSAKFLADILDLEAGLEWSHFVPVKTANGVTIDRREEFRPGHYAFLVSDTEFDAAFGRICAQGGRYHGDQRPIFQKHRSDGGQADFRKT
jgi:hypothetical protein